MILIFSRKSYYLSIGLSNIINKLCQIKFVHEETMNQIFFTLEKQPLGSKGDKIEHDDMPMEEDHDGNNLD